MSGGLTSQAVVIGSGPAGTLLATLLAESGCDVTVYEGRQDLRTSPSDAGRSINMTLAERGIVALDAIGVMDEVRKIAVPLTGRMVHADGQRHYHRYGRRADDMIHSISRTGLNAILIDRAESTGRVRFEFERRLTKVDFDRRRLTVSRWPPEDDGSAARPTDERDFEVVFGADGSNSTLRAAMIERGDTTAATEPLGHGYRELRIPPGPGGTHLLEPGVLHIWPRGEFLLIAFANPEGSFTVTLFLPNDGPGRSFASLHDRHDVEAFFAAEFPSFVELVPDAAEQFHASPQGHLETMRSQGWSVGDCACLVGDAAHTLVPFHGQGMNLALESVHALIDCLHRTPDDRGAGFAAYEAQQRGNADAIAEMALSNYVELRATVLEPQFLLERETAFELERRWPRYFARRYDMVTFTSIPFATALERSQRQDDVLQRLIAGASSFDDVDFDRAPELLEALGPVPNWVERESAR